MVHLLSTPRQTNQTHARLTGAILAAAAGILVLPLLAGCGESPTAEANHAAAEQSDRASRKAASAGDYRPTESLAKSVIGKSESDVKAVESSIKSARTEADFKKFVVQKPAKDDLDEASKWLTEVLSTKTPDSLYKSLLQAQLAQNSSAQAQLHIARLTEDLNKLANKAAVIDSLAQQVRVLGASATLADKRKGSDQSSLTKQIAEAKTTAETAATESAAKQKTVDDLTSKIASLRADAAKLYNDAQTKIQVADKAKGDASVKDFAAGVDMRRQADEMTQQAANLSVELTQARTDAKLASVRADEAKQVMEVLTAAEKGVASRSATASTEAEAYRAAARAIVDDKDPEKGLNLLIASFKTLADEIDTRVGQAKTKADDARSKYASAATEYDSWARSITSDENIKDKDPLRAVAKDGRTGSFLKTLQASASQRSGSASLIAQMSAEMQDQISRTIEDTNKATGLSITTLPAGAERAKKAQADAVTRFQDADKTAKDAVKSGAKDVVKWLALTVQAEALRGIYDAVGDTNYRNDAAKAAKDAMDLNPNLDLKSLTGT